MGVSISTASRDWYIPVSHLHWEGLSPPTNLTIPSDFFSGVKCDIVFHNAKFDLQVLKKLGVEIPTGRIWDTMIMHHYIDENIKKKDGGHDLATLGQRYLGEGQQKRVDLSKAMKENWERIPPSYMEKYAAQDTRMTLELYRLFKTMSKQSWLDQWDNYDRRFMLLLAKIEDHGLLVDRDLCAKWEAQCDLRMQEIRAELGFDPAKSTQLHSKLFEQPPLGLGLDVPSRTPKTGLPQVSGAWLRSVGHPVTALCYEYRKQSKQKSSYFTRYLTDTTRDYPRLHCSFNQNGTATGRLSSSEPNLQQIPREEYKDAFVKKVFLPEDGRQLWEVDYRTLEYRMSTIYSQEPVLLDIFQNEGDFHQQVADDIGIGRHSAKTVNYIMSFGGGVGVLAAELGLSEKSTAPIHKAYKAAYPKLFQKIADAASHCESTGGEIDMWYGRTRHFHYPGEYRKAFNAIIQGGSFEVVKRSMLLADEAGIAISNQVHDSVWLPEIQNEKEVEEAQHIMSDWTTEFFGCGITFSTDRKRLN